MNGLNKNNNKKRYDSNYNEIFYVWAHATQRKLCLRTDVCLRGQIVINEHVARTTTTLLQVAIAVVFVACWAYISARREHDHSNIEGTAAAAVATPLSQHNYIHTCNMEWVVGCLVGWCTSILTTMAAHICICVACVGISSSSFSDRKELKVCACRRPKFWRSTAQVTSHKCRHAATAYRHTCILIRGNIHARL